MSEEAEEKTEAKLSVVKTALGVFSDGFLCSVELRIESGDRKLIEAVIKKLHGMRVSSDENLSAQAIEVLKNDLEVLKTAGEVLKREHQNEVAQLLQDAAYRTRELGRLQNMEKQLSDLATLPVPPTSVVR